MLASIQTVFADIFHDDPAPAMIGVAAIVILISMVFRYQREKMWNDTLRKAIDKGQQLPPNLMLDNRWGRRRFGRNRVWRDLRAGLIIIAVSIGISLDHGGTLFHWHNGSAILFVVGAALLVNALIAAIFQRRDDSDSDLPPKS